MSDKISVSEFNQENKSFELDLYAFFNLLESETADTLTEKNMTPEAYIKKIENLMS